VRSAQGLEDFGLLMRHIHHTADFAPGSLRQLVRGLGREVEETAMISAERLRAEGRTEGEVMLLLKQLALRFGPLPAEVHTRVSSASVEELARFGERVLTAGSLAEVLG
jgi:hypothetical protein